MVSVAPTSDLSRGPLQPVRLIGGLALAVAAPLQLAATVLDPDTYDSRSLRNPLETPAHRLFLVGYLLVTVGFPAVYQAQAPRGGRVGAVGFLLALAGSALTMAVSIISAHLLPLLATSTSGAANLNVLLTPGNVLASLLPVYVLTALSFFPGYVVLGFTTARAGIFPSWSGWVLAAGAVATLAAFGGPPGRPLTVAGSILLGAGLAGFGWTLLRRSPPSGMGFRG